MTPTPEEYFETTTPPKGLKETADLVERFIEINRTRGKCVVLVTSGGTTVPLENQTVRFLDNFSAGTRGATSAEHFIAHGYAVIFLHREWSLEPFTRNYTHSKNCFFDFLEEQDGQIVIKTDHYAEIKDRLRKYQSATNDNLLLKVNFTTVSEYLFLLKEITIKMNCLKDKAMFYLAAAVSDFFIPQWKMTEHKIQSSGDGLSIVMDSVPKIIKPLVKEWAPLAYTVSFKLETDPSLLTSKSKLALERYGHQLVVGNMLTTRKHVVWLISNDFELEIRLTEHEKASNVEIESHLIERLLDLHRIYMNK